MLPLARAGIGQRGEILQVLLAGLKERTQDDILLIGPRFNIRPLFQDDRKESQPLVKSSIKFCLSSAIIGEEAAPKKGDLLPGGVIYCPWDFEGKLAGFLRGNGVETYGGSRFSGHLS